MSETAEKAPVQAIKGFDAKLQCRGFQFEVGKTYTHKGDVSICSAGFHSIEGHPFEVWQYYPPSDEYGLSRYAIVACSDQAERHSGDSKICSASISVDLELTLPEFIQRGVDFILSKVDFKNAKESATGDRSAATNTGYQSAATNTGDRSAATNTGDWSAATNTGDWSAASVSGDDSVALASGYKGTAATSEGSAIFLVERDIGMKIVAAFSGIAGAGGSIVKADGKTSKVKTVKPDTFYTLKNGKLVEAASPAEQEGVS